MVAKTHSFRLLTFSEQHGCGGATPELSGMAETAPILRSWGFPAQQKEESSEASATEDRLLSTTNEYNLVTVLMSLLLYDLVVVMLCAAIGFGDFVNVQGLQKQLKLLGYRPLCTKRPVTKSKNVTASQPQKRLVRWV